MKFNKIYFIFFVILLAVEFCIAYFLKSGFIRHTFGDVIVVIMIYCLLKSFLKIKPIVIGIFVLLVSFCIEYLQYFNLLEKLNLQDNKVANLVLGNTFQLGDLLAYTVGIAFTLFLEFKFSKASI